MTQAHTAPAAKTSRTHKVAPIAPKKAPKQAENKVEKKADERFLGISTATLVHAIENASGFGKSALNLEIAVGLALFAKAGKADIKSKKYLFDIYAEAGYQCKTTEGADYKTTNRRINVVAELFNWLGGKSAVDEWTVATSEMQMIQAIVNHVEELNFKGMNGVLERVGKPVAKKAKKPDATHKAANDKPMPSEADLKVMGEVGDDIVARRGAEDKKQVVETNRRSGDVNCKVIQTKNLHIALPYDVDKSEVLELAMQLLQYAQSDDTIIGESKKKAVTQ